MNLLRFITAGAANAQATLIQAAGLWMFAALLILLARSVREWWFEALAKSFVCLALALALLRAGFALGASYGRPFYFAYFVGEYFFLHYLLSGVCGLAGRSYRPDPRMAATAAILVALALTAVPEFSLAFVVQAAILAAGLLTAAFICGTAAVRQERGAGVRLLGLSLLMLGIGFAQYVPVMTPVVLANRTLPEGYATFMPVFDLLFESLLACSIIVTGMESVNERLVRANVELEQARSRLDLLAKTDPLTDLLNRHAFAHVMASPPGQPDKVAGAVAVADLNGLKAINDTWGHDAGDRAIRAFAGALRERLRADDLVFRWGGDEFLVVAFGLAAPELDARLASVGKVRWSSAEGPDAPTVSASFGVTTFSSLAELRAAASAADARMYESRRAARGEG